MLFHRIDDIGGETASDIAFMERCEEDQVAYILAVIPTRLSRAMAERIQRYPCVTVFQHGFAHVNAAGRGRRRDEFPPEYAEAGKRLAEGKNRLQDMLGSPVFGYAPPWNNTSGTTLRIVEELGFRWFSGHVRHTHKTTLLQLNVQIDPIEKYDPFILQAVSDIYDQVHSASQRCGHVGVVFHARKYPSWFSHLMLKLVADTAHLAYSPDKWRAMLYGSGREDQQNRDNSSAFSLCASIGTDTR